MEGTGSRNAQITVKKLEKLPGRRVDPALPEGYYIRFRFPRQGAPDR